MNTYMYNSLVLQSNYNNYFLFLKELAFNMYYTLYDTIVYSDNLQVIVVFVLLCISILCCSLYDDGMEYEYEGESIIKRCKCCKNTSDLYRFCFDNLSKCNKFKILCERNKMFNHLIKNTDETFVKEPVEKTHEDDEMTVFILSSINIYHNLKSKRDKIMLLFIMYDLLLRNTRYIKKYKLYTLGLIDKLIDFSDSKSFLELTDTYSIDYKQWLKHLNYLVKQD